MTIREDVVDAYGTLSDVHAAPPQSLHADGPRAGHDHSGPPQEHDPQHGGAMHGASCELVASPSNPMPPPLLVTSPLSARFALRCDHVAAVAMVRPRVRRTDHFRMFLASHL